MIKTCPAKICPQDCPHLSRQSMNLQFRPVPGLSRPCPRNLNVAPVLSLPL
jgi:hypothetical protein